METLTLQHCQKIISKICNDPRDCYDYTIAPYSNETIGFLGDHFKVTIKSKSSNGKNSKHEFFMKTFPISSKNFKEYVKAMGVFNKEVLFYKHILPKLTIHQESFAPSSILTSDTFIILEDLKNIGYSVHEDFFGFNEWEPLLKSLAKLHAASIAFEEQHSKGGSVYRFNREFPSIFKETTFNFDFSHPRGKWLQASLKTTIDILQCYNCDNKNEISTKLLKFVYNKLPQFVQSSERYRNVVNHADLWRNNVMFKRTPNNCKEAVLLDYQLIRYVPPAFDILTTLYLNSERQFLENNFVPLLSIYYGHFSTFLRSEGIDCNLIMPVDDFINSIEEYKLPAIIEATFFGLIVYLSEELSKKITTDERVFHEFTFENRSKYVLKEYRENCNFKYKIESLLAKLVDIVFSYRDEINE